MTLEELQARLAEYRAAETAVLKMQEYVVGQGSTARRVRRADLSEIRAEIASLEARIAQASAAAARTRRVHYLVPR